MLLELSKALTFFASILSFYPVAIAAFFLPGTRWEERLTVLLPKLAIAACICVFSGLLFSWPSRSNPDRGQPLTSTLPMRLFFWALPGVLLLFAASWYLVCGAPGCGTIGHDCACLVEQS
jgi:hypothetical protein